MARLETSIEIAAPANVVFAYFVPQRMPYWYGVEIDAGFELADGVADFSVGQKVRITGHAGRGPGARDVSLTAVVTAYVWERLLEWRFKDAYGVSGKQRWELEPLDTPRSGGKKSRVRMLDDYQMPGRVAKWLDALFTRRAVARRNRDSLARLKKLCEKR